MASPLITVIIPFKNEGCEVYNTILSIKKKAANDFNIVLINDASDDGYNYQDIAQKFNAKYIENKINIGVAASREKGISECTTEYFMLLDAHMRSFTSQWDILILNELQKDQRTILCTPTLSIDKQGKPIYPSSEAMGAGVKLDISDLSYSWININLLSNNLIDEIPCIMGASYSSNITYWNKIKGVKGLRSYGYDEQFLSMKTILEGGKCKIIKNVVFGHIFRAHTEVSYVVNNADVIFNQLYIAELLFPYDKKIIFFRFLKSMSDPDVFNCSIQMFKNIRIELIQLKIYFKKVFTRDFEYLETFNT